MTFDEYLAIDALNWSTLKRLTISPLSLHWDAQHPKAPTAAMRLGSAIDCALLTPDVFEKTYLVMPDFGDMRFKVSKEKKKEWEEEFSPLIDSGSLVVSHDVKQTILRCASSIDANDSARELVTGKAQRTLTWIHEQTGIKCKGRPDVFESRIVDLKSTSHASLREIMNDAARRDYHGQVAWYHHGAAVNGELPPDAQLPCAVFVQTVAPYDVAVLDMEMAPETFAAGLAMGEELIRKYDGCKTANWWPGMAPEPVAWTLPRWKEREL